MTPKQERFCQEYLVDLNGTQAAIRAGYSEKTAGQQGERLLRNVEIAATIRAVMDERAERTKITSDYVLSSLQEVAERCMQRSPVMVGNGKERQQAIDEEGRHVWEFNAMGANKSLELLGKHLALFTERVELQAAGSVVIYLPDNGRGDQSPDALEAPTKAVIGHAGS